MRDGALACFDISKRFNVIWLNRLVYATCALCLLDCDNLVRCVHCVRAILVPLKLYLLRRWRIDLNLAANLRLP
jgi:hypothetical protein